MASHSSVGYSPRPPRPQVSQRHPFMASHSSIGYSPRPPRPQESQRHPRMTNHSSIGYSPRRPRPQESQRHPHMTNHSSVGYSTLPKYLQVRWMGCYGGVRVNKKVTEVIRLSVTFCRFAFERRITSSRLLTACGIPFRAFRVREWPCVRVLRLPCFLLLPLRARSEESRRSL